MNIFDAFFNADNNEIRPDVVIVFPFNVTISFTAISAWLEDEEPFEIASVFVEKIINNKSRS